MSIFGCEGLFGHLKKNGFDLEATHITNGVKLEKLFTLVVWAFIFSVAWGCHLREKRSKIQRAPAARAYSDLVWRVFWPSSILGITPIQLIQAPKISMSG